MNKFNFLICFFKLLIFVSFFLNYYKCSVLLFFFYFSCSCGAINGGDYQRLVTLLDGVGCLNKDCLDVRLHKQCFVNRQVTFDCDSEGYLTEM